MFNCENVRHGWARGMCIPQQHVVREEMRKDPSFQDLYHWSRRFEYPFVGAYGDFKAGQWVLDAAGGDTPLQFWIFKKGCQVVNIDWDEKKIKSGIDTTGIITLNGDLSSTPLSPNIFDRVVCVSLLEHCSAPETILQELWRLLKPGGKLLLTFDVASYARWNHTIDEARAAALLRLYGVQELPEKPTDISRWKTAEIERNEGDPAEVELRVIYFCCDKKGA